jgi:5'(3')-deoxyribonucleotidase
MKQLFIDLDGVLADMLGYYAEQFNERLDRNDVVDPPNLWENICRSGTFFRDLPLLHDARELWDGAKRLHPKPIILSGIPRKTTYPHAEQQKREWVAQHIERDATVICCESRHKRLYGKPGDVLVDDWHKYRDAWEEMGGIFILHTSAASSLTRIEEVLHG